MLKNRAKSAKIQVDIQILQRRTFKCPQDVQTFFKLFLFELFSKITFEKPTLNINLRF